MQQPRTFLHCSRRTAAIILTTIFLLFLLIGCASMLRKVGMSPDEANHQAAIATDALADAAAQAVENIQEGLAQGKPLPTIATETASAFAWQITTIAASTIGAVLSGLLAKWLGTERKISAACITGIEKADNPSTKDLVHKKALAAGIETQLAHRVQALT